MHWVCKSALLRLGLGVQGLGFDPGKPREPQKHGVARGAPICFFAVEGFCIGRPSSRCTEIELVADFRVTSICSRERLSFPCCF